VYFLNPYDKPLTLADDPTKAEMPQGYSFKSIESISADSKRRKDISPQGQDFISPDYRIVFSCRVDNPPPEVSTAALLEYPGQEALRKMYFDAVNTPGFLASGMLSFHDYGFFENCALPIDVFRREAIVGEPLFWGKDFAEWYADTHKLSDLLDRTLSGGYVDYILGQLRGHIINEPTVILSAPGQEIYGHWLLDTVARLDMLTQSEYVDMPILFNNLPAWADFFLKSFGVDKSLIRPHPARFFKVQQAIIPSSAKSGFRLGDTSLKNAWARLNSICVEESIGRDLLGAKIYFTRRKLSHNGRRGAVNADDVETCLINRGYKIVAPETLSIPQQVTLMRNARIVVGEDGSALHNVIFGEPGMKLGVLTLPERTNMWHLGICHLLGHKCAYYRLPAEAEQPIDLPSLGDFLDVLEA